MLCLTLDARTMEQNLKILERNKDYISIVELRTDMLLPSELPKAKIFPSTTELPVILTVRRPRDGGQFKGTEDERKDVLKELSQGKFAYVDMEVDLNYPSLEYQLISRDVNVIRSMHDFSGIPKDIPELARVISSCGEIPKIAITPRSTQDQLEFFRIANLLSNIQRKILIGMGKFGLPTRILYKRLGSMLTYCSQSDPNNIGLPTPQQLATTYRSPEITKHTTIHAVQSATVVQKPDGSVTVPFVVDDQTAFKDLCELLNIE